MFQLNPKENCHFKLFRESAYCISEKKEKQREKIKIYYHLLKILLKINKTNTNKTQQKSPTLSLPLYISPSSSLSLSLGWPTLWGGGCWENSFAYKLWEAGIVIGGTLDARSTKGEDFHVQISASPTLCIIISSAPKKETPPIPNPAIIPTDTSRFRPNPPAVPLPQKAPLLSSCLHPGLWCRRSQSASETGVRSDKREPREEGTDIHQLWPAILVFLALIACKLRGWRLAAFQV